MNKVFLVFIGGGIGTAARYGTNLLAVRLFGTGFPFGTLMVNLAGCFLIGVVLALSERTGLVQPGTRLFVVTGVLGGLTTFSSFAVETVLAVRGSMGLAVANFAANNVGGLILVVSGFKLMDWLL